MKTQLPAPAVKHEQDNPGHRCIPIAIDGADYGCVDCGATWQCTSMLKAMSPFGGLVDGVPRVCPVCMADPTVVSPKKYRQFLIGEQDTPGVDYRCTECGVRWATALEWNTTTATDHIDWTQPQPDGIYRCEDGWTAGGAEFGCMKRADTTCSNGELRCTQHALIFEITGIRAAMVSETEAANSQAEDSAELMQNLVHAIDNIGAALWEINYTHMSLTRRMWYRARGWMWDRRTRRLRTPDEAAPESASDELGPDHAW
jgi:hypothetical protein